MRVTQRVNVTTASGVKRMMIERYSADERASGTVA